MNIYSQTKIRTKTCARTPPSLHPSTHPLHPTTHPTPPPLHPPPPPPLPLPPALTLVDYEYGADTILTKGPEKGVSLPARHGLWLVTPAQPCRVVCCPYLAT